MVPVSRLLRREQWTERNFTIELRDGSRTGPLLGSQVVRAAPLNEWFDATVPVRSVGMRDLYVLFRSEQPGLRDSDVLTRVDRIHAVRPPPGSQ